MKVLIIDAFPADFPARIRELGAEVVFAPSSTPDEAVKLLGDADVLVINSKINLNAQTLAQAPRLKLVCRAGVGLDHFDLPYLASRNIRVFFTAGANAVSVAEQTAGMLIALMHNIVRADRQVKQKIWQREENRGTELMGKTAAVIGHGNTGSAVARRLQALGMNVIAYDKYLKGFASDGVEEVGMDAVFSRADVLSLHVPLTDETRYLVRDEFINRFSKPIWLLNLSRGPVVKTADLIRGLAAGTIRGAALDVLENEKLETLNSAELADFEALCAHERVILSPHIGGWSFESLERINSAIVDAIQTHLNLNL